LSRLKRGFFRRYTPDVARDLLGCVLIRSLDDIKLSARIVEVEAYRGPDDPASHAYRGMTNRTRVMFGEAGFAYVYFTYGNHYCLNVTTEGDGVPGAVLIRGLEPLRGLGEMRRRRGIEDRTNLTNGPGKLTKAMGIDLALNGEDMVTSKRLHLLSGLKPREVGRSPRIGISVGLEREWRYYVQGSPYVSGAARMHNYRTVRTRQGRTRIRTLESAGSNPADPTKHNRCRLKRTRPPCLVTCIVSKETQHPPIPNLSPSSDT
jgi:DNA-3-methyladenine glycosylase